MDILLNKAIQIATEAHKSQIDKAGMAYILHPMRVAEHCKGTDAKIVAILHDTIEDTSITPDYLIEQGFPEDIIDGILSVTRKEGEDYYDFVKRAGVNHIGRQVKLADLEDNLDIKRLDCIKDTDIERINRYIKSYNYLASL